MHWKRLNLNCNGKERCDKVALRTTCINVKFKIIKIKTGCQYTYMCLGYFYYSDELSTQPLTELHADHRLDVAALDGSILQKFSLETRLESESFNPLTAAIGRPFFGHKSPAARARELFKPSTDSASLLVDIEKKSFTFSVGIFWRWCHNEGMFWKFWSPLADPRPNTLTHSIGSKFCWKLGQNLRL